MTKFCTQCGTSLMDGMKFCGQCGTAVAAIDAPAPAVHVQQNNKMEPNWLGKLAYGKLTVGQTYFHLVLLLIFAGINQSIILSYESFNAWLIVSLIFFYGLYAINVGLGLWRSVKNKNIMLVIISRLLGALVMIGSVNALFNALTITLRLISN